MTDKQGLAERLNKKGDYKIVNGEAVFVHDPESLEAATLA